MLPLISKEIEQQRSIVKGLQNDAEKGKAGQEEIDKAKKKLGELTDQYRLLAKEADYTSDKINKMKKMDKMILQSIVKKLQMK